MLPTSIRRPLVALLAVIAVAACSPAPTFDPSRPCPNEGRQPGAYPELEGMLPTVFADRPADRLDSGRSCTPESLGTLARHGVDELRFAGAHWSLTEHSGVTLAVFSAPSIEQAWMAEFYETGARAARRTENLEVGRYAVGDVDAYRLDTLNGESFQTVVVWKPDADDFVRVVLVGSFVREVTTRAEHDRVVADAVAAFEEG